ncbi:transcription factor A, mitochondrial-like [Prorops nasuta]|uniref:transcription factor A, mitochondrial-like n=1 Tax=Prorops nasuta TaxID=863751 RepID=UPI0034CE5B06
MTINGLLFIGAKRILNPGNASFNISQSITINTFKKKLEKKYNIPQKPKRPKNPYLLFAESERENILKEEPNLKVPELSLKIGQKWKTLDSTIKEQFKKKYQDLTEDFKIELAKYNNCINENNVMLMKKELKPLLAEKKKQKKLDGKPIKPPSSMILFLSEKNKTRDKSKPYKEWLIETCKEYKNLSEESVKVYRNRFDQSQVEYKKALDQWNKKNAEAKLAASDEKQPKISKQNIKLKAKDNVDISKKE